MLLTGVDIKKYLAFQLVCECVCLCVGLYISMYSRRFKCFAYIFELWFSFIVNTRLDIF